MKRRILALVLVLLIIISSVPFAFAALRGDVNGDGSTNSSDALLVLQYSVGLKDEINTEKADVNNDGNINSSDALIILQISVGIIADIKAGFIYLDNEDSAYDRNFMQAAKEACRKLGVVCIEKTGISEGAECTAAAEALVNEGCTFVFAVCFWHDEFLLQAAKKHPAVQFVCALGTRSRTGTDILSNFHNAYASAYEGRYLTGIAAGLKLNEMISDGKFTSDKAKLGFVGSYASEMISDYTAFYLGAKSVCPSVTMDVQLVGNWHNEVLEKDAAEKLIGSGCKIICEYIYSPAVSKLCEEKNIPNVSYNGIMSEEYPNTSLISARINWEPYFEYALNCMLTGKPIEKDYCGSLEDGSVIIEGLNEALAAEGTKEKLELAENNLKDGTEHVFDTSLFTVGGKELTTCLADVDADYKGEKESIANGYFHECEYRSSPYFDVKIDGINLTYSKSSLVTYTNLTGDCDNPRNHVIDTITIHCYVGQVTAKQGCDYFVSTEREVSSNYVIGKDGSIGLSVPECARAWTSSSRYNDQRAITIEVASDTTSPYAITDKAYTALVNLCADICARNGIKELIWKNDKTLIGQTDKQNMTVHRWFSNTDCPGNYLMNHMSDIAAKANAKIPK